MLAYLLIFFEYYKTSKFSFLVWNFVISCVLSVTSIHSVRNIDFTSLAEDFIKNSVGILGILVGFSISMFTLLNTVSNANIDQIKKKDTGQVLYGKPVFLFDLLIVSLVYIVLLESILFIFNLLFPFYFDLTNRSGIIAFGVDVFLIIHIVLVNVSTTVDFYFIITKKEN